ncbi:MAG: alanine--glyoxylate aminotransferase family protein, partial [Chloroflexi bacterium]|nr:alanine--glyoxylate aminotransferase family protein [Chloroflexota bacterium]
ARIIRECQEGVLAVSGSERSTAYIFAGSGTLAQEAAVVNLVAPGERMVVVSNGYFGDRFADLADAHGIQAELLTARWGTSVNGDALEECLAKRAARAVVMTQVETSTGVAAPVQALARVARNHGALVIVDAVCALGGVPMRVDDWGIDVVLAGAQKALGVPPGLTILAVSPEAMERRRSMDRVAAYYADLLAWEASMEDPRVYFSTHAVNHFYALQAALRIITAEGLAARFARHERLARAFRAGMAALGFRSLAEEPYLAPTLSVLAYPEGVEDEPFRSRLSEHGVVSAGCLGEFRGKGVRFGHMGNVTEVEIFQALAAAESALVALGTDVEPGRSLAVARESMAARAVPV